MLADKIIKAFKESTDAPEGKEKVPSYIHRMADFSSLEAEQRRSTASYAITVTFDGGFMTNMTVESKSKDLHIDLQRFFYFSKLQTVSV